MPPRSRRRSITLVLPIAAALVLVHSRIAFTDCDPQFPLAATTLFPATASYPHAIAVGDVDRDGHLDVVMACIGVTSDSGTIATYRGTGSGSFKPVVSFKPVKKPNDVVLSDLNGDGWLDAFTADGAGGTVSTLMGNGLGRLIKGSSYAVGPNPFAVAVADFDQDGVPDVAVSLNGGSSVTVVKVNANGTFAFDLASIPTGTHPTGICAADLNADGYSDLAIASSDAKTVVVALGIGNGTFQAATSYAVTGNPSSVLATDEDHDGKIDLIVSSQFGIDLLRGSGAGTFMPKLPMTPTITISGIALADFDHDGFTDLAAALPPSNNRVAVLRGTPFSSSPYQLVQTVPASSSPIAVAVGDFNEDGITDIVSANYLGPDFSLTLGGCVPRAQPSTPISLLWTGSGRPIAAGAGVQSGPIACNDGAGGAFIAWIDNRNGNADLFATHIDASGNTAAGWTPQGDAISANASTPINPHIVIDGFGGAVLVWDDTRNGLRQTWAVRLRPNQPMDPGWRPDGMRVSSDSLSGQALGGIAKDGAGGVFVAWGSGSITRLGHLNGAGIPAPGWSGTGLTIGQSVPNETYSFGSLAPDESGGVWAGGGVNGTFCIPDAGCQFYHYASMSHYSAFGTGLGGQSLYGPYPTTLLFPDGANGVIALYDLEDEISRLRPDGSLSWTARGTARGIASDMADGQFALFNDFNGGLLVQHYGPSGVVPIVWQPSGLKVCSIGSPNDALIVSDAMSGAVVTWLDMRDGTSQLYGQHVGADTGIPTGASNGVLLCSVGGTRLTQVLVPSVGMSAIEIWQDTRFDGGDIYAQRISWDGAVPVAYALVSASATPAVVDLRWYSVSAAATVKVERASGVADVWNEAGVATPDGNGYIAFSDHSITAGTHYGYRLRLADGTVQGVTWLDVPTIAHLSLTGATPNPASGPLQISFGLPNAHSAQLELFDISGRRVVSREVGRLGAGSHVLDLGTRMSAGVYLARLTQDGGAITRRVMVLR